MGTREITSFGIEELREGASTRLTVAGALDLTTADDFLARVRSVRTNGTRLVLDLADVNFMDSTGLAALINAISEARRANCPIELRQQFSLQVKRLLEITGAYQTLAP